MKPRHRFIASSGTRVKVLVKMQFVWGEGAGSVGVQASPSCVSAQDLNRDFLVEGNNLSLSFEF